MTEGIVWSVGYCKPFTGGFTCAVKLENSLTKLRGGNMDLSFGILQFCVKLWHLDNRLVYSLIQRVYGEKMAKECMRHSSVLKVNKQENKITCAIENQ